MEMTQDEVPEVLVIEESDEWAERLREHLTKTRVTRIDTLSQMTAESLSRVGVVLLNAGTRAALERFFEVRMRLPELPVVVMLDDDGDELALCILQAGAEDCIFRDQVNDGATLRRALLYATERRRLREAVEQKGRALQAREAMFRRVVESQADAVVIVDDQRRVRFANPAAERLFDEPAEALVGRALHLPIEPGFTTTTRTSHDERLLEIRAVDIEWESAPAVLASLRDISESVHKELDALRRSQYEMLGVLAGGIAHDLNNFLTSLCLNLHFALEAGRSNPRLHEIIVDMQKALPRASELTQQLLTFAKGGTPVRGDASLGEVIGDTTRFALRGTTVRCELMLADDLWPVHMAGGPLSQIINNLVVNARQAMPKGGTLTVEAFNLRLPIDTDLPGASSLARGTYVHVQVRDEGHGIPAHHLERIFEPYFTTRRDGNGLGLAICRSILQSLGGTIAAQSSDHGSCFHLYVPARGEAAAPMSAHPLQPRLLFMDDEDSICRGVARLLEDEPIDVVFAHDGFEALREAERARSVGRPFEAAILDVTIPGGMGAEETLPRLRALNPALKAVVSSASTHLPVMTRPRDHGFEGCMAKPYSLGDLASTLRLLGLPADGLEGART